jgi:3-hydroxyacyl-CoA dehydrogenase
MKLQEVRKIALFGAGTMGPGIAQVFALAGYEVAMYSRKKETLDSALSVVRANLRTFIEHGLLKQEDAAQAVEKITPTQSIEEAAKIDDVVVESIVEKKYAKK